MRVKIGDRWFQATEAQPIMVELTDRDRDLLANMDPSSTRLAEFHESDVRSIGAREAWMHTGAREFRSAGRRYRDPRFR